MRTRIIIFFIIIFYSTGCRSGIHETDKDTRPVEIKKDFPMISIPAMITVPEERAKYLAIHYWDLFDFRDTALLSIPGITEQGFVNFLDILPHVPAEQIKPAIETHLSKAEADTTTLEHFIELYDKYLYDPNSPFRNEELYILVLEYIDRADSIPDILKIRPRYQLRTALRNRVGTPAADFTYTLASGKTGRLYGLQSDYIILYFNNPDCPACKEIQKQIIDSPVIDRQKNKVNVLALYPDKDLTTWRDHLAEMPEGWFTAYDAGMILTRDSLYDLRAIPTLYLLDKNKKVLLKDASFDTIESYLSTLPQ